MDGDHRNCSRESCKPRNVKADCTVKCFSCNGAYHLPCYEIEGTTLKVFCTPNIVFVCDQCLSFGSIPSPKRKSSSKSNVENQIVSTPYVVETVAKIDPLQQLQTSVNKILSEIESNSTTLKKIDTKIDSLNGPSLVTDKSGPFVQSFSSVLRNNGFSSPLSSRSKSKNSSANVRNSVPTPLKKPSVSGTSSETIGKPLSPKSPKAPPKKSIWISRLHRDTSEADITEYVKRVTNSLSEFIVRKLVKKDRDISTYSFVSFRITCSLELFDVLINNDIWPSSVNIREFEAMPYQGGVVLGEFLNAHPNLNPQTSSAMSKNLLGTVRPPGDSAADLNH